MYVCKIYLLYCREVDDDNNTSATAQTAGSQQHQPAQSSALAGSTPMFAPVAPQPPLIGAVGMQVPSSASAMPPAAKTPKTYAGHFLSQSAR